MIFSENFAVPLYTPLSGVSTQDEKEIPKIQRLPGIRALRNTEFHVYEIPKTTTFTFTSIGIFSFSNIQPFALSKNLLHSSDTKILSVGMASASPSAISTSLPNALKTGNFKPVIPDTNLPES